MVIAFREIGKGHQALVDFARIANTSCMNNNAPSSLKSKPELCKSEAEVKDFRSSTIIKDIFGARPFKTEVNTEAKAENL